jgi:hypothetical protein
MGALNVQQFGLLFVDEQVGHRAYHGDERRLLGGDCLALVPQLT